MDEDGCYKGELHDFMGALSVIEQIVIRLEKEREEIALKMTGIAYSGEVLHLFNFENKYLEFNRNSENISLFDTLIDIVTLGYAFMPYAFYQACKDQLEEDEIYTRKGYIHCYKLKEGESIKISAR